MDILEEAKSALAKAYSKGNAGAAIPPELLTMLMDILMDLLSGCLGSSSAKAVADRMRSVELIEKYLIRRATQRVCEREGISYLRNGRALANAVEAAAKDASESDALALCQRIKDGVPGLSDWNLG